MKAIVAVDKNWGIGCQGKLLTHLPEDLKFFKEKTLGKVVVMGRETLETLPGKRPLQGRTNIVLTGNEAYETTCRICSSIDEALALLKTYPDEDVFIIGGEQVYRQFLPYCNEIYVTRLDKAFQCDKHFPNLDLLEEWKLVSEGDMHEYNGLKYQFTKYTKGWDDGKV